MEKQKIISCCSYALAAEVGEHSNRLLHQIYCHKTRLLTAVGKFSAALNSIDSAVALGYEPIRTLVLRAQTYTTSSKYQQAVDDCNRALHLYEQLDLNDEERVHLPAIFIWRGLAAFRMHNYKAGHEDLDEALRLNPNLGDVVNEVRASSGNLHIIGTLRQDLVARIAC